MSVQGQVSFFDGTSGRLLTGRVIQVSVVQALGRGSGIVLPVAIAAWFGANRETDSFFLVFSLILFMGSFLTSVAESGLVPQIVTLTKEPETLQHFLAHLLTWTTMTMSTGAACLWLGRRWFLMRLARLDPSGVEIAAWLLIALLPLLWLMAWASILEATMNAYQRFLLPATSWLIRTVVILLMMAACRDWLGIYTLPWAYVAGEFARFLLLTSAAPPEVKRAWRPRWKPSPKASRFWHSALFLAAGFLVLSLIPVIDRTMAAWLGLGQVSFIHYAERLFTLILTILTSGFTTVLLSHWSHLYSRGAPGDRRTFEWRVFTTASRTCAIATGVCMILWISSPWLLRLVLGRGEFPLEDLDQVRFVYQCYLLGLVPTVWSYVYARAHLVVHRADILCWLSMLNVTLHILLNLVLMRLMGTAGLALSSSIVTCVIGVLFVYTLRGSIAGASHEASPA